MRAFEVFLNGKRLCLAGIGNDGVLSVIANWVTKHGKGDLFFEVGGLVSSKDEHVRWINQKPLRIDDKLLIKVVETDSVDSPVERKAVDRKKDLRAQKSYVRMMAKKFGWRIQISRKSTS